MAEIALALLRRFWPYIAGAAALLALVIGTHFYMVHQRQAARAEQYAADKATLDKLTSDVRATTAAAQVADRKHADDVNTAREQARKESEDEYAPKLADARARALAYARLHPAPSGAGQGGGGTANLPGAPDSSNVADGPYPDTIVPGADLDACTEAVTRLQSIQSWWDSIQKGPQ